MFSSSYLLGCDNDQTLYLAYSWQQTQRVMLFLLSGVLNNTNVSCIWYIVGIQCVHSVACGSRYMIL